MKNSFVLATPMLSPTPISHDGWIWLLLCLVSFCLASSAVYMLNDAIDSGRDRNDPRKRHRPVASGRISPSVAIRFGVFLAIVAVTISTTIPNQTYLIVSAYIALNVLYCLALKDIPVIDLACISTGFAMRAMAGAVACSIAPDPLIIGSVFFLTLHLGLSKRLHETRRLGDASAFSRPANRWYSSHASNSHASMLMAMAFVLYAWWTIASGIPLPPVIIAALSIGRFSLCGKGGAIGENLSSDIFRDKPLFALVSLWMASIIWYKFF